MTNSTLNHNSIVPYGYGGVKLHFDIPTNDHKIRTRAKIEKAQRESRIRVAKFLREAALRRYRLFRETGYYPLDWPGNAGDALERVRRDYFDPAKFLRGEV